MPYQNYPDGLYLLIQKSVKKGVDHYGIMDVGNILKIAQVAGIPQPVVIHQTPPSIQVNWLQDTGKWKIIGKIIDEKMAISRIKQTANKPNYDLFGNNCEHFARFVATGTKESTQVQSVVWMTGLVALTMYALRK